jgi:hypothetical protein
VLTKSSKKVNGRWTKGGTRYDKKSQDEIDKRYHEKSGWRNGAKVTRR